MRLAPEGIPQMIASTVVLGAGAVLLGLWYVPAAIPAVIVWAWSITFFRDPQRQARFEPGVLCAPADGRVTDVTRLDRYEPIDGPAVRIGIFLTLFDVHINRWPCAGTVRSIDYRKGKFLAAMNPRAGEQNESATIVLDPDEGMPGPVVVRQVAGIAARRIVCHARVGDDCSIGGRFGLIKFGSRTELIVPEKPETQLLVQVGDKIRAGLTPLLDQARAQLYGDTDGSAGIARPTAEHARADGDTDGSAGTARPTADACPSGRRHRCPTF